MCSARFLCLTVSCERVTMLRTMTVCSMASFCPKITVYGAPDFSALQAAISDGETKNLVFFVFDQMFDGKEDLRPLPLSERKARLEAHVADAPANIRYVDHFITAGDAVLTAMEGLAEDAGSLSDDEMLVPLLGWRA